MASVDLIVLKDRFSTSKTVKTSPEKNLRNRRNHFFFIVIQNQYIFLLIYNCRYYMCFYIILNKQLLDLVRYYIC